MNTPSKALFQETQRFTQWWMWFFALIPLCIGLYGSYVQFHLGVPFGNKPMSDTGLLVFVAFGVFFAGFLGMHQLTTKVTSTALTVHFYPYTRRKVAWEEVDEWSVIPYDFVGGWGVRLWTKYGTVYNVKSGMGLYITLKNKKRFLVSTQQPQALQYAVGEALSRSV